MDALNDAGGDMRAPTQEITIPCGARRLRYASPPFPAGDCRFPCAPGESAFSSKGV
jgi:hypothetical protein